jgi:hypothetical protein
MRNHPFLHLGLIVLLTISAPLSVLAQDVNWKNIKFEFSTGVSIAWSLLDSSYHHQYSPPFLSGAYVSNAEQTIYLKGKTAWGVNAALNYYPSEKLGLQLQVEWGKPKFNGNNSPYPVSLNYSHNDSAGNPPYPHIFERTYGWPDTEGNLNELCVSLNLMARLPLSRKITLNIAGGPTYFWVKAEGVGLAYSKYCMEEGFFVGETYQIKYKLGPLQKLGTNLGLELNWVFFGNVSFVSDLRYYGCSKSSLPLDVLPNEMLTDPLAQVKQLMNLGEIEVNPSFYRLNLGLKYLF